MPDEAGGARLEPAITQTVDHIHAELGGRRATPAEFDELFGHRHSDGEGWAVATGGWSEPWFAVRITASVWQQEVERYDERSEARLRPSGTGSQFERNGLTVGQLQPSVELGPDGTTFGGAYRRARRSPTLHRRGGHSAWRSTAGATSGGPDLALVAFGERHPERPAVRNAYVRAHKRLHGRCPDE